MCCSERGSTDANPSTKTRSFQHMEVRRRFHASDCLLRLRQLTNTSTPSYYGVRSVRAVQGKFKSESASPRSQKGFQELLRSGTGFSTEPLVSCGTGQRLGRAVAYGAIAHKRPPQPSFETWLLL